MFQWFTSQFRCIQDYLSCEKKTTLCKQKRHTKKRCNGYMCCIFKCGKKIRCISLCSQERPYYYFGALKGSKHIIRIDRKGFICWCRNIVNDNECGNLYNQWNNAVTLLHLNHAPNTIAEHLNLKHFCCGNHLLFRLLLKLVKSC